MAAHYRMMEPDLPLGSSGHLLAVLTGEMFLVAFGLPLRARQRAFLQLVFAITRYSRVRDHVLEELEGSSFGA